MSAGPRGDLRTDLFLAEQLIARGRHAEAELILRAVLRYAPTCPDAARLLATAAAGQSRVKVPFTFWQAVLLIVAVLVGYHGVVNLIMCVVDYVKTGRDGVMLYHPMALHRKYGDTVEWVPFWEALGWALVYVAIAAVATVLLVRSRRRR